MDIVETWDWRVWSLLVLLVVAGWFGVRLLAALVFRHVLLDGVVRRYEWQAHLSGRRDLRERRAHRGPWRPELTLTGMWRGRRFAASQVRRVELSGSGENVRRKVRRRALLSLTGSFPVFDVRVSRLGRVRGQAPPTVLALVRARRWRFRGFHADGAGLSLELGPRLRRGRLLAALNYLSDAADRLG